MKPKILLRTKILLVIVSVVIMISTVGLLVIQTTVSRTFKKELHEKIIGFATHTASQAVNPLLTQNTFELELLVRDIKNSDKDITYLFILDASGQDVLAHSFEKEFPSSLAAMNPADPHAAFTTAHFTHNGEKVIDIAMPVLDGKAGTLRIGVSEASVEQSVRGVSRTFLLVIIGIAAAAIVFGVFFSHAITRPITELTEAAQDVIDGNMDRRANASSRDEIGYLASTFNAMITSRELIENQLRESEERYRSLVESTEDSIYLVDREYRYLFMNHPHLIRMELQPDAYQGRPYSDFHSPEEVTDFVAIINEVFAKGESIKQEHLSMRDNRHFLRTFSPVRAEGAIIAVSVVSKDISELKQLQNRLFSLSLTDDLTGLYNRRGFFTLVDRQIKLSNRAGTGIYMIYADLDNLKEINDRYGHSEGDRSLTDISKLFQETFRESDIIARIGGDEFVIIPAGTTPEILEHMKARFEKSLEAFNALKQRPFQLSISMGIAFYDPSKPASIDDLLQEADRSMYEVKRSKHGS